MSIIGTIIYELKSIIDLTFTLSVIAIGLFTFFVDSKQLRKKEFKREASFAKVIGISCIIAGPLLYVALMFV